MQLSSAHSIHTRAQLIPDKRSSLIGYYYLFALGRIGVISPKEYNKILYPYRENNKNADFCPGSTYERSFCDFQGTVTIIDI